MRAKIHNRPFAWAVDKYNIVGRLAQVPQDRQGDRQLPSVSTDLPSYDKTPGKGQPQQDGPANSLVASQPANDNPMDKN